MRVNQHQVNTLIFSSYSKWIFSDIQSYICSYNKCDSVWDQNKWDEEIKDSDPKWDVEDEKPFPALQIEGKVLKEYDCSS